MRGSWISYFAWRNLRMALQLNVFQKVVYKESKMVTQILQWRIYYHRLEAHSTLHTGYFNHRTQIKCSRDFLKVFYVGEFILYSHDLNTKHVRFSNGWSLFRLQQFGYQMTSPNNFVQYSNVRAIWDCLSSI